MIQEGKHFWSRINDPEELGLLLLPEQEELVDGVASLAADVGKLAPCWSTLPPVASHVLAWARKDQTRILSASENPGSCPSYCTTRWPDIGHRTSSKEHCPWSDPIFISFKWLHFKMTWGTIGSKAVAFAVSEGNLGDDMLPVYHPWWSLWSDRLENIPLNTIYHIFELLRSKLFRSNWYGNLKKTWTATMWAPLASLMRLLLPPLPPCFSPSSPPYSAWKDNWERMYQLSDKIDQMSFS